MQHAQNEQKAQPQPCELATLPPLITGPELAAVLRVPVDYLPKLVAAGAIPAPVVSFQRTKRWSRDAVLAVLGGGQ